jgi:hypothetical protein
VERRIPVEWTWFEGDEESLDGTQTAFIETVRSHAASWLERTVPLLLW